MTVKAELPAYGGFSLARGRGSLLLVRNAIPGETVAARIDTYKKNFALASAVRIFAASPDRIEPTCPVFGVCGGCHHQFISYPRQVSLKQQILQECVSRIARRDTELSEPFISARPWNFRYRGQFKLDSGSIGFYGQNSKKVVDIEGCRLMRPEVNTLFSRAREIHKSSPGLLDGISDMHISCGDEGLAMLKSSARITTVRLKQIGKAFMGEGFEGICIKSEKNRVTAFGREHSPIGLDGLKYTISPRSIFQGHWELNKTVVNYLREALHPLKGKRVMILYAGSNFSLPLALDGAEVFAIEENPTAIEDGMRNAAANGIRNCRFIECSAERLKIAEAVDSLVVYPPGKGLSNSAVEKIISAQPRCIAYLACNPSSAARDIKKLLGRYDIESMRMVDCLPQTYHVKSLTLLRLR